MSMVEIGLAVLGGLNLWIMLNIQLKVTQLELRVTQTFLTKGDFENWTSRSNQLPSFDSNPHRV